MSILKFLECNRCKKKVPFNFDERTGEWRQIYRVGPSFSPSYSEDVPVLCPGCVADLETFLAGGGTLWIPKLDETVLSE